ncbi:MAG: TetR/AcrR family transcriptional regulator [Deltaproteobacteria bacterium]|nr:TetR/AcrR family transcriptional regulator [Deltaproteobacteria bacterium]
MERAERKEKEFHRRRTDILGQAEKVFAAKGFYGTTVAEIAGASGYAVGTIYHFFEGKEDLFTAMITEKMEAMYSEIRRAAEREKSTTGKIRALVSAQFRFVEKNREFCAIFIRRERTVFSEGNDALKKKIIVDYMDHISYLESVLSEGVSGGFLRQIPPRSTAFALAGMINSFIVSWMYTPGDEPLSSKADSLLDIFLKGAGIHEL